MSDEEFFDDADYLESEEEEKDEMDLEDEDLDFGAPMPHTKHQSYEVIQAKSIMDRTKALVKEVVDTLALPSETLAALLLRRFEWNKQKLIDEWLEDPDRVLKKLGMTNLNLENKAKTNAKFKCPVCDELYPAKETFALGCGHRYCADCWRGFLTVQIRSGPTCTTSHCPAPKCPVLVHEEAFRQFCAPEVFAKYQEFLYKSFVDDNPFVKWCPAPGCNFAVRSDRKSRVEPVTCKCTFRFCFNCADFDIGDHTPATCDFVQLWRQKATDESENVKWLLANTKKCPQCRAPIEKNGGCMHMTCRTCRHEWCWLCRGPWSEHGAGTGGYYSCNKYDSSKAKEEDASAEQSKTELEYYMFYYHRYESHKGALAIADQQWKQCDRKEEEFMKKFNVRSTDTKFLHDAVASLLEARRVLEWSYVYGYYLTKGTKEKNLYEYLQEDLEKHTDALSKCYETDNIETYQQFMKWKEDAANLVSVTRKFFQNFTEGVASGLTSS